MLTFLAFVVLVFWVGSLSSRVGRLEVQLRAKNAQSPLPVQPAEAAKPKLWHEQQAETVIETAPLAPVMPVASMAERAAPASSFRPSAPQKTEKDEAEIASNWLNKIGVVAVLLGMGLFFKYAVDQNWITPWMRVGIGFGVGGLFVVLGWLWRQKYARYANVMIGGGVAIWYFTIFAMYGFYQLVPQTVALALMVLASLFSIFMAYYRKSVALAALGMIGAYGAPIALTSGQNRQLQLLVYLSVLNLAVLVILARNFWSGLALFSVIATWMDFSFWYVAFSGQGSALASVMFFMLFFTTFFVALAFVMHNHAVKNTLPKKFIAAIMSTHLLAAFVYLVYVDELFAVNYHAWMLWLGLFASAAAFLAYAVVDRLEYKKINYTLSFLGFAMLLFAFSWQWSGEALALSIILAGGLGAMIASGVRRAELRLWSTLILIYSFILVVALPGVETSSQLFIFNTKFGLTLLQVFAMLAAAWYYGRSDKAGALERHTDTLFNLSSLFLLWLAVSLDIGKFFPSLNGQYGLAFWWIVYPLALGGLGMLMRKNGLIKAALFFAVLSLVRSLAVPYPSENLIFLFNFKFGIMALQAAAIFILAKWSERLKSEKYLGSAEGVALVTGAVFLWLIVTLDLFRIFTGIGQSVWLALWWVIYPVLLIYFAKVFSNKALSIVALVLMALGFFRVLFLEYNPEGYLFIVNSKFGLMALEAFTLLVVARLLPEDLGRQKASDFLKVAASLFLWFAFSWELVRYYSLPEDGNTRNLFMSLWWIAYAVILIVIGTAGKSLLFRKVAMALFGASILKVFLYDVLALETGYRIVSFIVLGVILLSVSYAYQKNREKIVQFLEGVKREEGHV